MVTLQALFGLVVFIGIAALFSEQRRMLNWQLLASGLGLQFLVAFVMFRFELLQALLNALNQVVVAIADATETGSLFLFGYLGGDPSNVAYPFSIDNPEATVILAFRILPLILIFTVLSAILWHFRILPLIVRGFSIVLRRVMGVSGAVGLSAAANIFIGMVESPALIRPYIKGLTRSELFVVMSCGMATIAGTVMVLYSVILGEVIDNALGHILTASVISAPAAIMLALIMVPATPKDSAKIADGDVVDISTDYHNVMDAIVRGTSDGLKLMVNVGAMLLVFIALVALFNSALLLVPYSSNDPLTLQTILGWMFAPLVWLMGIPWQEAQLAGTLMGIKTALN